MTAWRAAMSTALLSRCWVGLQRLLFPSTCVFCGAAGEGDLDLCGACRNDLALNLNPCPRCAAPLQPGAPPGCLCGQCVARVPAFDQAYAPFLYQDMVRHLVRGLKYQSQYPYARLLGELLAACVVPTSPRPQLLVPVPLHPARYRERGFNQSLEIARSVAKRLQIPLQPALCVRRRNTEQQSGLTAKQRRKNVRNAFAVPKPIPGAHVVLLDDVMTTGSTAHELAKALREAGASRIDVWACARAGG